MNRVAKVLILVVLAAAPACTSPASTKEEFLASTADTAYAVKEGGRTVFWDVPRFVLWTIPKAVLYDLPSSLILAIRGNRARVQALVSTLYAGGVPLEEEVAISEELRELTGIPIHAAGRWKTWWKGNAERPEREWRRAFVEEAVTMLTAPGYFRRAAAVEDLKAVYGTDLGYDPKASPEALESGAERWRQHVARRGLPPKP